MWSKAGSVNNRAGNSLLSISEYNPNFCLASPKGLVTYLHPNGSQSVLDLCFCSAKLLPSVSVKTGPCLGSDHLPLLVWINITPIVQCLKTRQKFLTKNVNWDNWRLGLPSIKWQGNININDANNILINHISSSTAKIKKSTGYYNPRYNKDW